MAEFTKKELRKARESRNMPRWKLGNLVGVSESTIERWEDEDDKSHPEPDDVDRIEKALEMEEEGIWYKWMRSNYDSFRKRFSDAPDMNGLTATVAQMKYEMLDIMPLIDPAERDTLNGEFNDPATWKKLKKEVPEAMAAMQKLLDRIPDDI